MITIIRWFMLKSKQIKLKLAFYSFVEKFLKADETNEMIEKFKEKVTKALAEVIHEQNQSKAE